MTNNTIQFNPSVLSQSTITFLQSYNTGAVKSAAIEARNNTTFGGIAIHEVPGQLMAVLTTSTFNNDQSKQTFKISCQRFFRACHQGKALVIKGDSVKVHTLAADETTDHKGKVVKVKTADQIAAEKAARGQAEAAKKQQALDAEQAILRLDAEKSAREQAEATAAAAIKHANELKKEATATVAKAETATELLSKQVAELTLQLERAKHETSATIVEYNRLVDGIRAAKNIGQVKALITLKGELYKPEFTATQIVEKVAALA